MLLSSACATTPTAKAPPPAHPSARAQVQPAGASIDPALDRPQIGEEELKQARALLFLARDELEPAQWEMLDTELREAEAAWVRFSKIAGDNGRVAEVTRGAKGRAEVGRTRALPRVGPLLVLLILLWPASTAGPESEALAWLSAKLELEAKLRDVSEAAQQVRSEIDAARKKGNISKPVPAAPKVLAFAEAWVPVPGEPPWRPCMFKGSGGPGPSSPLPVAGWIRCTYQCGRYEVEFHVWGKKSEDCKEKKNFERAEQLARRYDAGSKGR